MPRSTWISGRSGQTDPTSKMLKSASSVSMGRSSESPRKFAKYPLENKVYHGVVMLSGLAVIITGICMMFRVRTIFFPRNPYLFSDMTWGMMYVLHGLAGVGLITLTIVHVYFAIRPEKLPITASMIVGSMSREFYLKEHDPKRWVIEGLPHPRSTADGD